MNELKKHWSRILLHLIAATTMIIDLTQGHTGWVGENLFDPRIAEQTFDPGLEAGKWAIRFLLICLSMTPINSYLGWRYAIRLRKPAGLWAFAFAAIHLWIYITNEGKWHWLTFPMQPFIALGLLGMIILMSLTATSNKWAMQGLKKNWKRLHRLVYLACSTVIIHAIMATNASKKLFLRDPDAIGELRVCLILFILLMLVRLKPVRQAIKKAQRGFKRLPKSAVVE